jgi:hypothetical protein
MMRNHKWDSEAEETIHTTIRSPFGAPRGSRGSESQPFS